METINNTILPPDVAQHVADARSRRAIFEQAILDRQRGATENPVDVVTAMRLGEVTLDKPTE
jgi:hypothetical protein